MVYQGIPCLIAAESGTVPDIVMTSRTATPAWINAPVPCRWFSHVLVDQQTFRFLNAVTAGLGGRLTLNVFSGSASLSI
jgi:hypothetical protein